jgi:sulfofructose kinase
MTPEFDVVGVGLNATDTLLTVPRFPAYAGKARILEEVLSPGGQVASALVACARLGLRARYIGTVGDDERGRIQLESLRTAGIDLGERTIFWRRDDCLQIDPEAITGDQIAGARLLLIDGHDAAAVARAAELAHSHGIPVVVDVDTIYAGFDRVLPNVDYLVASSEFPTAWTGEADPFRALEQIQNRYGMKVAAMTLGAHGALARYGGTFVYAPAFVVNCVDTTGAGDLFSKACRCARLSNFPTPWRR